MNAHSLGFVSGTGRIFTVDKDASGSGDGTSWTDAYVDLLMLCFPAIRFSKFGWFRVHIYRDGFRASGFVLPPDIAGMEGFRVWKVTRRERDATDHLGIILSGDIGVTNDSSDNSYNVVIPSNGW